MVSCSRASSRPTCAYCKARPAEMLCDQELRGAKAGKRCDGKLCRSCAYTVPGFDDRQLCPPHKREADKADAWLDEVIRETEATFDNAALAAPSAFVGSVDELEQHLDATDACTSHDWDGDVCTRCSTQGKPDGTVDGSCAELLQHQVNMYGCRPCPKCGDVYRAPVNRDVHEGADGSRTASITCDGCGYVSTTRHVVLSEEFGNGYHFEGWLDDVAAPLAQNAASVGVREVTASQAAAVPREDNAGLDPRGTSWWGGRDEDLPPATTLAVEIRGRELHRLDGGEIPPRDRKLDEKLVRGYEKQLAEQMERTSSKPAPRDAEPRDVEMAAYVRSHVEPADVPIAEKVAHVRAATQDRDHTCHWRGCRRQCKPAYAMCREHWYTLPKELRDKVWRAYAPGQEETLTPSRAYLDVMREVNAWIAEHQANNVEPRRTTWDEAMRRVRERDATRTQSEIDFDPDDR